MKLDFFTRQRYLVGSLAPIWNVFPREYRGDFFVGANIYESVVELLGAEGIVKLDDGYPAGSYPILTCSYGDMMRTARAEGRKIILMQHGIGHTFGTPAYMDGGGRNDEVDLWLAPNRVSYRRLMEARATRAEVIGMPKSDEYTCFKDKANASLFRDLPTTRPPVIALSCHWGDATARPPETGSAWDFYKPFLPKLAKKYKLIGHSHPIATTQRALEFQNMGIEFVPSFDEVLKRADIYISDTSSTLYEFILTGKPVILLNAPWFRRDVDQGIRFWDYADIGIQVDHPHDLQSAIDRTIIEYKTINAAERVDALNDLFPYAGEATNRAVTVLVDYIDEQERKKARVVKETQVKPGDVGVMYMCFGDKARAELSKSYQTLKSICPGLPAVVVGDGAVAGLPFIPWRGESPFDPEERSHFQFRAGRVKPFLYDLSPFARTLYMDVDTEVSMDIMPGFNYLDNWDFAVAQERHSILGLYNSEKGKWYHDMEERETTIEEFGGCGYFPFINSGVFMWKKNERTQALFENWHREWMRFQQWDEQAALLRAINKTMVKPLILAEAWNFPHKNAPMRRRGDLPPVIVHLYGRGRARSSIKKEE